MLRKNTESRDYRSLKYIFVIFTCLIIILLLMAVSCVSNSSTVISSVQPGDSDTDKDSISDAQEISLGLNPHNPDSDGDGLTDISELNAGLNPRNPDTDNDGILDAEDFFPNVNNTEIFLYSGIGIFIILIGFVTFFHIVFGFSQKRKNRIKQDKADIKLKKDFIEIESKRILELAQQRYGTLTINAIAEELSLDTLTIKRCLEHLKVKKEGEYYHFPEIEKVFAK